MVARQLMPFTDGMNLLRVRLDIDTQGGARVERRSPFAGRYSKSHRYEYRSPGTHAIRVQYPAFHIGAAAVNLDLHRSNGVNGYEQTRWARIDLLQPGVDVSLLDDRLALVKKAARFIGKGTILKQGYPYAVRAIEPHQEDATYHYRTITPGNGGALFEAEDVIVDHGGAWMRGALMQNGYGELRADVQLYPNMVDAPIFEVNEFNQVPIERAQIS